MILAQVEELEDVGVPGFDVDGEGTGALVASLVNVAGSRVIRTKHRHNTVREVIRTDNV